MSGLYNPGLSGLGDALLSFRITHVRLRVTMGRHHVEAIDLLKGDGFTKTPEQIHDDIIRRGFKYFTQVGLARGEVEPILVDGKKFVRTRADGTAADNLLHLPLF